MQASFCRAAQDVLRVPWGGGLSIMVAAEPHRPMIGRSGPPESGMARSTNYQRICDRLRAEIIDQQFGIGARLKVVELAARYGVSQMPVREALQQLQGEGLVRLIPNRGAVVRAVDESFIRNIYDIREILEAFFTRRAALVAGADDIDELRTIQSTYERYTAHDTIAVRLQLNLDFHGVIYRLAGNDDAREIIDKHSVLVRVLTRRFNHTPQRIRQICRQHRAIIAAIVARDPMQAGEIAGQHMRDARDALLEAMREKPLATKAARRKTTRE
jgi:DNA-binding GntR family transcriptional regulator